MKTVVLILVLVAAIVAAQAIPRFRQEREQAAAAEAQRAAVREKVAARKAQIAAENEPEEIERRRHEAQIAALEEADKAALVDQIKKAGEAACRNDAKCSFEPHAFDAKHHCAQAVERLAQYQHEWTDSIFGKSKFDRVGWADQAAGTYLLLGNAIKMQNGFGAWRNMSYRCVFDPSSQTAVADAE